MYRSSSSSSRLYINANGRLVSPRGRQRRTNVFSIPRFLLVLSLVLALILTNPANPPIHRLVPKCIIAQFFPRWNHRRRQNHHHHRNDNKYVTNYGFFSLRDNRFSQTITISALGMEMTLCSYENGLICRKILHDHATHGKPFWYDPTDRSYTAHRTFLWMSVAAFLWSLSSCHHNHVDPSMGSHHSWKSFFFFSFLGTNGIEALFHQCFALQWFIYPAFSAMDTLLSLQGSHSSRWWVLLWPGHDDFNYTASILFFIIMSVLINAIISSSCYGGVVLASSREDHKTQQHHHFFVLLDPFDALSACSIGYVTFCQDTIRLWNPIMTTNEFWWWSTILQNDNHYGGINATTTTTTMVNVTGQAILWSFLGIMTLRRRQSSFSIVAATWVLVVVEYWTGRVLAQYHYENIVFMAWIRQGWNWVEKHWMWH